jgi:hypothetical protein
MNLSLFKIFFLSLAMLFVCVLTVATTGNGAKDIRQDSALREARAKCFDSLGKIQTSSPIFNSQLEKLAEPCKENTSITFSNYFKNHSLSFNEEANLRSIYSILTLHPNAPRPEQGAVLLDPGYSYRQTIDLAKNYCQILNLKKMDTHFSSECKIVQSL